MPFDFFKRCNRSKRGSVWRKPQLSIDFLQLNKTIWLTNKIFNVFSQDVTGLKLYMLDCGCIYYQRVFRDGDLDP